MNEVKSHYARWESNSRTNFSPTLSSIISIRRYNHYVHCMYDDDTTSSNSNNRPPGRPALSTEKIADILVVASFLQ